MANQAIALQARAPQGNFLAPAIQQGAQMINMMSQQRAAERQAAVQQQQLEIQRAAEGRAARGEDIATRKANQDYVVSRVAYFQNQLPSVKDDASWNNWLDRVGKEDPEYAGELRRVSGGVYDPDYVNRVSMDAKTFIDKTIATPMATLQIGAGNKAFNTVVGGTNPGATPLKVAPARAAPAAPAVGAQPMAAPQTPTPAAGGMFQPISATNGQPQGEDPLAPLLASLNKANETGEIGADVVEQLRQLGGPQYAPAVDAFLAKNNIKVAPGGMRSAVYRPGEDAAPQMQMVQAYNQPGSQFQVAKDPNMSPTPGSASVPLTRVREEAAAGRATPAEAAAVASATATATKAAELKTEQAKKLPAKRQVSTLLQKIRGAYETLNTAEAIPSSERGSFANVFDYLSTTGAGREVQRALGTAANKPLNEITGARKLLATAIKTAAGMSAQEMNSNVELQLTLDALTDPTQGYESAISQLDTLEQLYGTGGAQTPAASAGRQTPVAKPPAGISADDWKFMTPEERRLWQK